MDNRSIVAKPICGPAAGRQQRQMLRMDQSSGHHASPTKSAAPARICHAREFRRYTGSEEQPQRYTRCYRGLHGLQSRSARQRTLQSALVRHPVTGVPHHGSAAEGIIERRGSFGGAGHALPGAIAEASVRDSGRRVPAECSTGSPLLTAINIHPSNATARLRVRSRGTGGTCRPALPSWATSVWRTRCATADSRRNSSRDCRP
jgi:hypothetical protein